MKGVAFTVDMSDTATDLTNNTVDLSEAIVEDENEAVLEYEHYRKMIDRVLGPVSG
jgi:hypothetical protein